jgi:thioesterase DpgC
MGEPNGTDGRERASPHPGLAQLEGGPRERPRSVVDLRNQLNVYRSLFESIGIARSDLDKWEKSLATEVYCGSEADSPGGRSVLRFIQGIETVLLRLPRSEQRRDSEKQAARALFELTMSARESFLSTFGLPVYDSVTKGLRRQFRVPELLDAIDARFAGLLPRLELRERDRRAALRDKDGSEVAEAAILRAILESRRCGEHLIAAMRAPTPAALELLRDLERTGYVDLGEAVVELAPPAAVVELRNPEFLNAEDDSTLAALEIAIDLVLLAERVQVGVLRGGFTAKNGTTRRVFSSGLNLTALAAGTLSYRFFPIRELGLVEKLRRGHVPSNPTAWIAVVDSFAIGGGFQILSAVDTVIAEDSAFFSLPATREGFVPGLAAFRATRWLGPRLARQMMLHGRPIAATDTASALICDYVVPRAELDEACDAAVRRLADPGAVSLSANLRALREGEEGIDELRRFLAAYVDDQARCMFSGELAEKLQSWSARRSRRVGSAYNLR